ncbi:MAG: cadmium-translocating P-type ATPase [Bacilli bacterium]|nr:cadmium-translocating P-type ATPase [Bacilli bacterium]
MKKIILKIDGMSCSACKESLEKYLNKQEGITANVNLVMALASINYDSEKVDTSNIEKFIEEAGFKSLGEYRFENNTKDNSKLLLIIYLILLLIIIYIMISNISNILLINYLNKDLYPIIYGSILLILTIPFIIYGFDIIKNGIFKLKHKSPNMDTLVTIGVIVSFIYSLVNLNLIIFGNKTLVNHLYFESCAMIIYFVKLGRFIDKNNKEKAKEAIEELVQITPEYARLQNGLKVTIDEVKEGDILIVRPGEKIAVDGIVTKGESHVLESFVTGESIPSKKKRNDNVLAGSINIDGVLEYKALKIGKNSTISEIVHLVEESINSKLAIGRLADKVSGIFVLSIIIIAIITFIIYLIIGRGGDMAIITLVSILVVSCPCAMGLATPLAIVIANGLCFKKGILVRNSEILEIASKIKKIVFDKTGTLTYGDLRVSRLANYSDYSNDKLLNIVASLEKNSLHPIASAFKMYDPRYEVTDFRNIEGCGITGVIGRKTFYVGNSRLLNDLDIINEKENIEENFASLGNSILYIVENKKIIGLIGVKDIVRKNTKKIINELKNMNIDIYMSTGDNKLTANIIAKSIGIENVKANLLPKEKLEYLKELKNNSKVMMIGDGINDAPALSLSDIGVSVNGAADISKNSSDIILLNDDLSKIITLIKISKKTIKIIKQNLFWAFCYNLFMIPMAMGLFSNIGLTLNPSISSIAMTLSSLIVVFNSLRLRKIK